MQTFNSFTEKDYQNIKPIKCKFAEKVLIMITVNGSFSQDILDKLNNDIVPNIKEKIQVKKELVNIVYKFINKRDCKNSGITVKIQKERVDHNIIPY